MITARIVRIRNGALRCVLFVPWFLFAMLPGWLAQAYWYGTLFDGPSWRLLGGLLLVGLTGSLVER